MVSIGKKLSIFLFGLLLATATSCSSGGDSEEEDNLFLLLLLFVAANNNADPAPVQAYVDRAAAALTAWNIGLTTGNLERSRTTDTSFAMSPQNWITVSNAGCDARGIPSNWKGSTCNLSGGTIGVCITRFYTSGNVGQLVDTTLVMLDTYQEGTSPDSDKLSVFTHEVGHCLGLQHAEVGGASQCTGAYINCIMFPSTAGADTPHADELTQIDAAYNPIAVPGIDRYSRTGGVAIRHWTNPVFSVSSVIGSAFVDENAVQETSSGIELQGSIETRVHEYKIDGSFEIKSYDNEGNLLSKNRK